MDLNCECVEEVEGELHFPPPDWKRPLLPLPLLLLLPRKCDVDEGVWLGGDPVTAVVVVVVVAVVAAVPIVGV